MDDNKSVFDIFTGKQDLEDTKSFVGALDGNIDTLRTQIESVPNFVPEAGNDRQQKYAQRNLVYQGDGSFIEPERLMQQHKLDQLQGLKEKQTAQYERRRQNPFFITKDIASDVFRNTVGLVPNMLSGGTAVTYDPSQTLDARYKERMAQLVGSQEQALTNMTTARTSRNTAFANGLKKTIGTAFPTAGGGLSIATDQDGVLSMEQLNNADGSPFKVAKNKVIMVGGVPTMVSEVDPLQAPQELVTSTDVADNTLEINQAGKKGTVLGEAEGKATVTLQSATREVESFLTAINDLVNHEGKFDVVGTMTGEFIADSMFGRGTAGADFLAKQKQISGKTFLQARDALKGAGQVTDFEGTKGEQAMSALNNATTVEAFDKAALELATMVQNSLQDMQKRAEGDFSVTPNGVNYKIIK